MKVEPIAISLTVSEAKRILEYLDDVDVAAYKASKWGYSLRTTSARENAVKRFRAVVEGLE